MDEVLTKKIDILLRNSTKSDLSSNYLLTIGDRFTQASRPGATDVLSNAAEWYLDNKHASLLIKLHSQLPRNSQMDLVHYLQERILDPNMNIRKVAAFTLLHTGNQNQLIDAAVQLFTSHRVGRILSVFEVLDEALTYQNNLFTPEQIETLYEWARQYIDGESAIGVEYQKYDSLYSVFTEQIERIYDKTNEILLNDFSLQIEAGYNPDISIDEKRVVEAIEHLGLPLDLAEALEHINDLVSKADAPQKYRDAMSAIRAFNERLIERIAQEIDPNTHINGKDSEAAAKEFKKQGLISLDVGDMLTSFRHFLSNDGTHRLKSKQEDARIAKSINIELSLYLLRRLGDVKTTEK